MNSIFQKRNSFFVQEGSLVPLKPRIALADRQATVLADDPPPRQILRGLSHPATDHSTRCGGGEAPAELAVAHDATAGDAANSIPQFIKRHI